jgi:hypothetical protein
VPIRFIMSVRPSFHTPTWLPLDRFFLGIWYGWLLWKSVTKIQIWSKSENNIRYIKWTPKYVYNVDSSVKHFTAQQHMYFQDNPQQFYNAHSNMQLNNMKVTFCCISKQCLQYFHITDSDIYSSSIHRIHYYNAMAIVTMWKCQNVMLYKQCLSCAMVTNTHTVLSRPLCKT